MKLVATDIPVIAKARIYQQERSKSNKVGLAVMVVGGLGLGAQYFAPQYGTIGWGIAMIAGVCFYWYTTRLDAKVKAYTHELMSEWKAENDG